MFVPERLYEETAEQTVMRRASELVHHRRKNSILHIDGHDEEANEGDDIEWMFYSGLEDAVDAFEASELIRTPTTRPSPLSKT